MKMMRWQEVRGSPPSIPVAVSFHTHDLYTRDAFELARSCQAHKLDFDIEQVPDLGSWAKNTSHKPRFLSRMAERYPERGLLWLDADARVRRPPTLFDGMAERIAYFSMSGQFPLSGTVFLGEGDGRRPLLEEWARQCDANPMRTDQECMGRACAALGIKPYALPVDFCSIWDFDGGTAAKEPDPTRSAIPAVEHLQSSRWMKRLARVGR